MASPCQEGLDVELRTLEELLHMGNHRSPYDGNVVLDLP